MHSPSITAGILGVRHPVANLRAKLPLEVVTPLPVNNEQK